MRTIYVTLIAVLALAIGGGGGFFVTKKYFPTVKTETTTTAAETSTASTSTTSTTDTDAAALETCLKAKWGESKYTAITANPNIATVDDKFNALPCYK